MCAEEGRKTMECLFYFFFSYNNKTFTQTSYPLISIALPLKKCLKDVSHEGGAEF